MKTTFSLIGIFLGCVLGLTVTAQEAPQRSQLEQALGYKPIQKDVEIDTPTADEIAQCELKLTEDKRGFIITGPQKSTIRTFLDVNGDNRVDQWSYFLNGVEVYRDVDSNGNGKADQYRWLNSAGTRWGIDTNEDQKIDYWQEISAEEVSREVALALAQRDVDRFLRVALNEEELKGLALGSSLENVVARKIESLKTGFAAAAEAIGIQGAVQWYQFNAILPGLVPSGDRGNGKDLVVYENAMTTVGVGNETRQIALGTLVKVSENNWRLLDLPKVYDETQLAYTFIQPAGAQSAGAPVDTEMIALINEVQEIQSQIPSVPMAQRAELHKKVFGLMLQIMVKSTTTEERDNWIRQLADSIMDAAGRNEFPEANDYFKSFYETVRKDGSDELSAHVRSRQIMTEYYLATFSGDDDMKAYQKWLENLEELVEEFPNTEAGVEGMMQLASNREMTARTMEEPMKWYTKVTELAADKPIAQKAKGAIRRLTAEDKEVPFRTNDVNGKPFDIVSLKGRFVLLCFWDSRVSPELTAVQSVVERFADAGLVAVGVNLDPDAATMKASVSKAPVKWPQLYAPGGFDSAPAIYWGVPSTPYMILYGKDGKVLKSNVQSAGDLQQIMAEATK